MQGGNTGNQHPIIEPVQMKHWEIHKFFLQSFEEYSHGHKNKKAEYLDKRSFLFHESGLFFRFLHLKTRDITYYHYYR